MIEHATDIIPFLLWIIAVVGAALIALILWVSKRLQSQVDAMPGKVSEQVTELHQSILGRMDDIVDTHRAENLAAGMKMLKAMKL